MPQVLVRYQYLGSQTGAAKERGSSGIDCSGARLFAVHVCEGIEEVCC